MKNTLASPVVDTTGLGQNIGRTMWLLESGTPEKRTRLKVMFYGQSIIDENNFWPKLLIEHLKDKYPCADIEPVYHLAVGGYSSIVLAPLAPMDMKWQYPDLVVALITGDHYAYDALVKEIKESTTADVMILTNHITKGAKDKRDTWEDTMENEHLLNTARTHGAELCKLRTTWRDYLLANDLDETYFLAEDCSHLNATGQHFLLSIVKQFFVRDEAAMAAAGKVLENEWRDVRAADWKDGVLSVPFHGNRVEVIAADKNQPAAEVRLDGKKPSDWTELYVHPRIGHGWFSGGILRRLEVKAPHTPQTWTIEFTKWEPLPKEEGDEEKQRFVFAYTVTGEKDGFLGASDEGLYTRGGKYSWENKTEGGNFDSPILKINGGDFYFGFKQPALNTRYIFEIKLNGVDVFDGSRPVVVSGLPVADHVLTLAAKDKNNLPDIRRIRVRNPGSHGKNFV